MCKISVIIPCFNAIQYIDRCMESLLKQTIGFENLEVIFVNDASTDNTLELLQKYENLYPQNIMIINYEKNRRQGFARNIGIQYSTAECIAFVDIDDFIAVDMFEKLYSKMMEDNYDYVVCDFCYVINGKIYKNKNDGKEKRCYINTEESRKEFILNELNMPGKGVWAAIYRKAFLKQNEISFPEDVIYEDAFFLEVQRFYAKKVCYIPEYLYFYVKRDDSTVGKINDTKHFDRLKVMLLYLQRARETAFYEQYKWEIEWKFLQLFYTEMFSFLARRFTECPVEVFQMMSEEVSRLVPDYEKNPYLQEGSMEHTLLKLVNKKLGEREWKIIFEDIREENMI